MACRLQVCHSHVAWTIIASYVDPLLFANSTDADAAKADACPCLAALGHCSSTAQPSSWYPADSLELDLNSAIHPHGCNALAPCVTHCPAMLPARVMVYQLTGWPTSFAAACKHAVSSCARHGLRLHILASTSRPGNAPARLRADSAMHRSTAVRENLVNTMQSYLAPAPVVVATTITSARRLLLQTTSAPYGIYVQVRFRDYEFEFQAAEHEHGGVLPVTPERQCPLPMHWLSTTTSSG